LGAFVCKKYLLNAVILGTVFPLENLYEVVYFVLETQPNARLIFVCKHELALQKQMSGGLTKVALFVQ
jgi:hypothetical protein